jgi:hypothetical protein
MNTCRGIKSAATIDAVIHILKLVAKGISGFSLAANLNKLIAGLDNTV